jgi:predicted alpha/beta-hydrolase family hydrolase
MMTILSTSRILLLVPLLFAFTALAASKSDLDKEKRWEEQIVPSLMVGEDVKLTADGVEFLALFTEQTTDQPKGAVILLHGIGVHPAWPDVIEPLRMELPDYGWHTLSLQMPVMGNEAENEDYAPLFTEVPARIQAGVDFLKIKGVRTVVISGHSLGSTMGSYYLANNNDAAVRVFAIVSGGPGVPGDARMDSIENFKKITGVAILDIYGSEDQQSVLDAVSERSKIHQRTEDTPYLKVEIDGAGHFYRDRQEELVTELNSRLDNILAP